MQKHEFLKCSDESDPVMYLSLCYYWIPENLPEAINNFIKIYIFFFRKKTQGYILKHYVTKKKLDTKGYVLNFLFISFGKSKVITKNYIMLVLFGE